MVCIPIHLNMFNSPSMSRVTMINNGGQMGANQDKLDSPKQVKWYENDPGFVNDHGVVWCETHSDFIIKVVRTVTTTSSFIYRES